MAGTTQFYDDYATLNVGTFTADTATLSAGTFSPTSLTVGSGGTTFTSIKAFTGTIASGNTSGNVTATGVDASSVVLAAVIYNNSTNAVSIAKAVPGTDVVAVTLSGDPGASGASIRVLVAETS